MQQEARPLVRTRLLSASGRAGRVCGVPTTSQLRETALMSLRESSWSPREFRRLTGSQIANGRADAVTASSQINHCSQRFMLGNSHRANLRYFFNGDAVLRACLICDRGPVSVGNRIHHLAVKSSPGPPPGLFKRSARTARCDRLCLSPLTFDGCNS